MFGVHSTNQFLFGVYSTQKSFNSVKIASISCPIVCWVRTMSRRATKVDPEIPEWVRRMQQRDRGSPSANEYARGLTGVGIKIKKN